MAALLGRAGHPDLLSANWEFGCPNLTVGAISCRPSGPPALRASGNGRRAASLVPPQHKSLRSRQFLGQATDCPGSLLDHVRTNLLDSLGQFVGVPDRAEKAPGHEID